MYVNTRCLHTNLQWMSIYNECAPIQRSEIIHSFRERISTTRCYHFNRMYYKKIRNFTAILTTNELQRRRQHQSPSSVLPRDLSRHDERRYLESFSGSRMDSGFTHIYMHDAIYILLCIAPAGGACRASHEQHSFTILHYFHVAYVYKA